MRFSFENTGFRRRAWPYYYSFINSHDLAASDEFEQTAKDIEIKPCQYFSIEKVYFYYYVLGVSMDIIHCNCTYMFDLNFGEAPLTNVNFMSQEGVYGQKVIRFADYAGYNHCFEMENLMIRYKPKIQYLYKCKLNGIQTGSAYACVAIEGCYFN